MLESFIVTLREGIEASLILGITLVYLYKTKREVLTVFVWAGLFLAVFASLLLGFLFHWLGREPFTDFTEGLLYLLSSGFVLSLVVWMWRTAQSAGQRMQQRLEDLFHPRRTSFAQGVGLLLFTFLMVGREGAETAFFLFTLSFSSQSLASLAGVLLGLGVAVLFCIFFIRGSVRINLKPFFGVTAFVLLIFALQLFIGGFHEWAEQGIIPSNRWIMAVIGPIVQDNFLILASILAIPFLLLVWGRKGVHLEDAVHQTDNPAQRRLIRAQLRRERFSQITFGFLTLATLTLFLVNFVYSARAHRLSPPQLVQPHHGLLRISEKSLTPEVLYRYVVEVDKVPIRFLAMKQSNGLIGTAFDACSICGAYGYFQQGPHLVCRNCMAEIVVSTLGTGGGCNPIPLPSHLKNGFVEIAVHDLKKEKKLFAGNLGILPEVTCPVCGMRFHLQGTQTGYMYQGKTYYFCSMPSCFKSFQKNPDFFVAHPAHRTRKPESP